MRTIKETWTFHSKKKGDVNYICLWLYALARSNTREDNLGIQLTQDTKKKQGDSFMDLNLVFLISSLATSLFFLYERPSLAREVELL